MSANFILEFVIVLLTILVIKEYYKIKKVNNRLLTLQRINKAFYWLGNQVKEVLKMTRKMLDKIVIDDVKVSFSYGMFQIEPSKDLSIEEIYDSADKNMYKDKARKKGIWEFDG